MDSPHDTHIPRSPPPSPPPQVQSAHRRGGGATGAAEGGDGDAIDAILSEARSHLERLEAQRKLFAQVGERGSLVWIDGCS